MIIWLQMELYCIKKLENGDVQVDYVYNRDYKMQRVYSPNAEIKVFRN